MAKIFSSGVVAAFLSMCSSAALADTWNGYIECSWGKGVLTLNVNGGSIAGRGTNVTITSGRISGSSVSFTGTNLFGNQSHFTGSLRNSYMAGTYSQGASRETCQWYASPSSGSPGRAPAAKNDDREREITKAKDYVERAEIVQRQPGCESQRLAAQYLGDASVIYRRLGMNSQSDRINAAADKLTGEGGTYYKCLAGRKTRTSRPARDTHKAPDHTVAAGRPSMRECLRAKIHLDTLKKRSTGDAGSEAVIWKAQEEIVRKGCKL